MEKTVTTSIRLPYLDPAAFELHQARALNTVDAANYTGLAPATLEKLRCTGGGPRFVSYSRRAVRYRVSELDAWMGARTISSTSERSAA